MRISTFTGSDAHQSKHVTETPNVSLETIGAFVTKRMWAPSLFNDNVRVKAGFKETRLLVLDIDEGLSIEGAKVLFARYRHVIGTTRNHQKEKVSGSGKVKPACDRFRVILELSETITSEVDYQSVWHSAHRLCPFVDVSCKDASRFYFPCQEIVHIQDGATYDVTRVLESAQVNHLSRTDNHTPGNLSKLDSLIKSIASKLPESDDDTPDDDNNHSEQAGPKGKISKKAFDFLTTGGGVWHSERNNFIRECKQNNYTFEEMKALFCQFHKPDATDLKQMDDVWYNRVIEHGPRISDNQTYQALLEVLGQARVIMDVADPERVVVINFESLETYDYHIRTISRVFGKQRWPSFLENDVIHAHFVYKPHAKEVITKRPGGDYEYNCYVPPSWRRAYTLGGQPIDSVKELPGIYEKFFRHLVDGHSESFEYLLDWLALSLQGRNLTFLAAIGEQGAGKGTLGEIMQGLHGARNFVKVRDGIFKDRFNGPLKNKTLVYVDEIDLKTKEAHDRIKDMVNEEIEIEEKGKDHKTYHNWASFYLSSNSLDAIKIEPGDRRFSIIQLTDKKLIHTDLIEIRDALVSEENINLLAQYLFHRKVDKRAMYTPFHSERYEEVREAGLKDWEIFVIEEWCASHVGKELPLSELQTDIEVAGLLNRAPGRPALQGLARKYPERMMITKGQGKKPWVVRVK
jgi:hypothetical protein